MSRECFAPSVRHGNFLLGSRKRSAGRALKPGLSAAFAVAGILNCIISRLKNSNFRKLIGRRNCSVSADRKDLQSDRRHRRAVSRFLALRGPTPALCCAGQVVIPSGFTPGSGPARGLSEGGHLEGQRVLPGAFALYRGGRTQDTQKSWLQKSERHLCQLELSANFGPDDPGMFFCGDVAQDRGVKRHIRRLARTGRPKTLSDGFCHQFLN